MQIWNRHFLNCELEILKFVYLERKSREMILHNIYFSAKGTTEMCAGCIGQGLNLQMKPYNWFEKPCNELLEISSEDVLLFSMPVYGGFIPQSCAKMARNLKGSNTPAIIAAVYGNRHYDDALLQMKDILTEQGFYVIAAGAFIAEKRSLFGYRRDRNESVEQGGC